MIFFPFSKKGQLLQSPGKCAGRMKCISFMIVIFLKQHKVEGKYSV